MNAGSAQSIDLMSDRRLVAREVLQGEASKWRLQLVQLVSAN